MKGALIHFERHQSSVTVNCKHQKAHFRTVIMFSSLAFNNNLFSHVLKSLKHSQEQFSDGVGYNWIDTIRSHASSHVNDEQFKRAKDLFPFNTPLSKEGFYYRQVFEEIFPNKSCIKTVKQWIPRLDWGCPSDPSGRAQKVHVAKTVVTE
jgi:asparagine synthetase B (glutamine-hydrolysing)